MPTYDGSMSPLVVCVGLTTLDLVQAVDALPGPNEKVVSTRFWYDVGGPAANAARVASRLGCRVRLVTALGASDLADLVRARLAGVEIVDLAPADHQLPVSTIMVTPDGARSVVSRNTAALLGAELPTSEVIDGAEVVLHDGHLMDASVALAARPVPIHVLDGGSWKPRLPILLPRLDIAVISADFAFPGQPPERALAALADYGIARLARSRGSQPVQAMIADQSREFPVPRVEVVDTTGAGDVLHGALIAHLAHGRDFTASLQQAIVAASASVTGRGVLAGFDGR